ncbi:bacteriohemerythrin [Helicovermis profundi]|uniref:Hemerythrin-like domain-containing protein n=1 Tax=Helicovermis profundi TaxID=3065157 RepID=A0AAU9E9W8_9FIRM|nr:hypothetical protein HLPR_19030 [Clostridia bacterium S502]
MIKWKDSYSVGYKDFDEQHMELIRLINKVEALIKDKDLDEDTLFDEVNQIFAEILDYTVYHFESEEKVFDEKNYENNETHRKAHQEFVENVKDLVGTFDSGKEVREIAFKIYNTLVEWLIKHILGTDKLYMKKLD